MRFCLIDIMLARRLRAWIHGNVSLSLTVVNGLRSAACRLAPRVCVCPNRPCYPRVTAHYLHHAPPFLLDRAALPGCGGRGRSLADVVLGQNAGSSKWSR